MELEKITEKPLGHILGFSLPAILSMVLTALVTVADGLFIGNRVGPEGLAAVNLGLPIVYLFLGVGLMASVGGAALAGMARGAGDIPGCRAIFRQTAATAFSLALLVALFVRLALSPVLAYLNVEPALRDCCQTYYFILLPELAVMILNSTLGIFIRAEGAPRYVLFADLLCAGGNILLDALFTLGLGWGIAGVAWASVLSALLTLGVLLRFLLFRAEVFRLGRFSFSPAVLVKTLLNGSSEMIGELSTGIAMSAYNLVILRQTGAEGVTAFTILGYTAYLFSMITVGFGQGSSPLVSFSYGAGKRQLARRLFRLTSALVTGAGAAVFLLTSLLAGPYARLFMESPGVLALVRVGAPVFSLSFLLSGFNAIASFYFTATGRALESAAISLSRGLVVLVGCILVLPVFWGMTGVWMAAPVTEGVTFLLGIWLLGREKTKSVRYRADKT